MDGPSDNRGIRCQTCGGKMFVSYGKDVPGGRERVLRCPKCATRLVSLETVKRMLPPTARDQINSIYRMTFEGGASIAAQR